MSDDQTIEALCSVPLYYTNMPGWDGAFHRLDAGSARAISTAIRDGKVPGLCIEDEVQQLKADLCVAQMEAESLPSESALEHVKAERDSLRAKLEACEGERDEAKARAIQAWKDADVACAQEVDRRIGQIMGSPDNEISRWKASASRLRDERDQLQIERSSLRTQLSHARSRSDDKEIAERERDHAHSLLRRIVEAVEGSRFIEPDVWALIEEARGLLK